MIGSRSARQATVLTVALLAAACTSGAPDSVAHRGDTTFVESRGPGVWGVVRTATVVQRITGADAETPFGNLSCVAADVGGGVAVFDDAPLGITSIFVFGPNGEYRRGLGRRGSGPGEYGGWSIGDCLEWLDDGTLLHLDPPNGRVNLFPASIDGSPAVLSGLRASGRPPYLTAGPGGTFFLAQQPARATTSDGMLPQADYLLIDTTGAVVRRVEGLPSLLAATPTRENDPTSFAHPLPDGGILLFRNDRTGFVRVATESGTVLQAHRDHDPIAVTAGEKEDRRRLLEWSRRRFPDAPPDPELNEMKPAFYYATTDLNGRVWLLLASEADSVAPTPRPGSEGARNPPPPFHWAEPTRFAAFESTGRYLGEVHFPVANQLWQGAFTKEGAWTIGVDSLGQPELLRWRF